MKRFILTAALFTTLAAGAARAEDLCKVPEAEWQPQQALETRLKADGWTIKKIKIDEGCYEVYGKNAKGEKMETYFDPKTFDVVKSD
jgi:hypothetical protein